MDKVRLLECIRTEYAFYERTLALLTPEEMVLPNVEGTWSVKDTTAHVSAWMHRVMNWFDQAGHNQPPDIPEKGYTWADIDRLNDAQFERDKDLPLDVVLADFRKAHLELCDFVQAFSEHELFDSTWDGLFDEPPWNLIPTKTHLHLYEHAVPIRQWVTARKQQKKQAQSAG
jgi:hypothetical protein